MVDGLPEPAVLVTTDGRIDVSTVKGHQNGARHTIV
jgi:hypothetical protein